jgi:hypothetical protein
LRSSPDNVVQRSISRAAREGRASQVPSWFANAANDIGSLHPLRVMGNAIVERP